MPNDKSSQNNPKKKRKFSLAGSPAEVPLSNDFYLRHSKQIFCVFILLIIYIDLRYECDESIYKIDKLKKELNDVRYTAIARWGELTSKNKPEIVRKKVAESSVNLISNDEPVIVIDK